MRINWMTAVFVSLCSSSRLRKLLWRWVYNKIAARDIKGKFILNKQDEPFRYFIQLYNYVVKDIDLYDKNIIEILLRARWWRFIFVTL